MKGPESYVHGLPGSRVVVVPGQVAAWISRYARLQQAWEQHRSDDPETVAVLQAIAVVAREFHANGSVPGTISAPRPEPMPRSDQMISCNVAAERLGITTRAVRKALADGRLQGHLEDDRWRINADSITNYRSNR